MADESDQEDYKGPDLLKAFSPFTQDEVHELRMLLLHVTDLEDLRLAQQEKLTMNIGTGGAMVEGVDKEHVAALMTAYRKIALLKKDPGTFARVGSLIGRNAHAKATKQSDEVLAWLGALKDVRRRILEESQVMAFVVERPDGVQETLRPKDMIDWLVNGVVSHSDLAARRRWDELGGWQSPGLLMNVLVTVSNEIQIFRGLADLARRILDTPELMPNDPTASDA